MSEYIDPAKLDLDDQVVAINRITKVVKGGRRMRFAALVIVGDRKGHVGFGTGKAQEVPEAIRKAQAAAEKNLITVPIVGTTIPHEVIGTYGGGKIMLKPAVEGSGVAAGGAVRNGYGPGRGCRCYFQASGLQHANQRGSGYFRRSEAIEEC